MLPTVAADQRIGDLRGLIEGGIAAGPQAPAAAGRAWTFTPSLDISETYDDGVLLNRGHGQLKGGSDFITRVTPGIAVAAATARVDGNVFYTPEIDLYERHGNQNAVNQNLDGALTFTLMPGLLFLDLRAVASQQSMSGGQSAYSTLSRGDQVLTSTYSATPRIEHRFGDLGTLQASTTLSRTVFDTTGSTTAAQSGVSTGASSSTSTAEHLSFTTGEGFNRLSDTLSADLSQQSGGGVLQGASSTVFNNNITYAATRQIAVLTDFGHEKIIYGGLNPQRIDDITWSIGGRWTPGPDTSLTVKYGNHEGNTSVSVDASMAPTARTRVYARYSDGLETSLQRFQRAVAASTVDANGTVIDSQTGVPIQLNNNFFGTQSNLYHTTSTSLSGVILYTRDTFTFTAERDQSTLVSASSAASATGFGGSTNGTTGSLTWTRELNPDLSGTAFMQYGVRTVPGLANTPAANQQTVTISLSLRYAVSPTLSATAQYTRTNISSPIGGQAPTHDIAMVALHKTF